MSKFLLMPDPHVSVHNGRLEFLEGIVAYANKRQDIGAVFCPGDFIGDSSGTQLEQGKPDMNTAILQNTVGFLQDKQPFKDWESFFQKKNQELGQIVNDTSTSDEDKDAEIKKVQNEIMQETKKTHGALGTDLEKAVWKTVDDLYGKVNTVFGRLKKPCYATLGNQDFKRAYKLLDKVTFVEHKKSQVKHKNLVLKGSNNTNECAYGQIGDGTMEGAIFDNFALPYIASGMIDYELGNSFENIIDGRVYAWQRQNQQKGEQFTEADLKDAKKQIIQEAKNDNLEQKIKDSQKNESARLQAGDEPNIFLCHKQPDSPSGPGGHATNKYVKGKKFPVFAGHEHGSDPRDKNEIWGEINYNKNGLQVFRPATDYFYVVDYNDKTGVVDNVIIYEMVTANKLTEQDLQHLETLGYAKKELDAIRKKYLN